MKMNIEDKMKMKKKGNKITLLVLGLIVLGFVLIGTGTAGAKMTFLDVDIFGVESRIGGVSYTNEGNETTEGNLTVRIDDVLILNKSVKTYSYQIGDEVFSPVMWRYFDLDETEGQHQLHIRLCEGYRCTDAITGYTGLGILEESQEEEESEEEELEDPVEWVGCP